MKQIVPSVAGTLESSDVLIRITPLDSAQASGIDIASSVHKQFGEAIRATVQRVLEQHNVQHVQVDVNDKGALDCVLRARLETALARAGFVLTARGAL
ncbi:citrate lyase acyl carrier protein [Metakosakonia massiliensis]|uniref:Citrate lyase acyl carrier protein n=1 Tax=Phytobacter massiliensis TaxID=1485952 RepID=A0A6N3DUX8_9ENTR